MKTFFAFFFVVALVVCNVIAEEEDDSEETSTTNAASDTSNSKVTTQVTKEALEKIETVKNQTLNNTLVSPAGNKQKPITVPESKNQPQRKQTQEEPKKQPSDSDTLKSINQLLNALKNDRDENVSDAATAALENLQNLNEAIKAKGKQPQRQQKQQNSRRTPNNARNRGIIRNDSEENDSDNQDSWKENSVTINRYSTPQRNPNSKSWNGPSLDEMLKQHRNLGLPRFNAPSVPNFGLRRPAGNIYRGP